MTKFQELSIKSKLWNSIIAKYFKLSLKDIFVVNFNDS